MSGAAYGVVIRTNDPFVALSEIKLLRALAAVQFGWAEYWRAQPTAEGWDPAPPTVAAEMRARGDDWATLGEITTEVHDLAVKRLAAVMPEIR